MAKGVEATPPKPPHSDLPSQVPASYGKSFSVKGDTAIKSWFREQFPGMSEQQLDKAANQFLMTIIKSVQQTIAKSLAKARKAAHQLRESEND